MDLALSQSAKHAKATFATRTIPLGEYWMTSGAGLPISSKKAALDALARIAGGKAQFVQHGIPIRRYHEYSLVVIGLRVFTDISMNGPAIR